MRHHSIAMSGDMHKGEPKSCWALRSQFVAICHPRILTIMSVSVHEVSNVSGAVDSLVSSQDTYSSIADADLDKYTKLLAEAFHYRQYIHTSRSHHPRHGQPACSIVLLRVFWWCSRQRQNPARAYDSCPSCRSTCPRGGGSPCSRVARRWCCRSSRLVDHVMRQACTCSSNADLCIGLAPVRSSS